MLLLHFASPGSMQRQWISHIYICDEYAGSVGQECNKLNNYIASTLHYSPGPVAATSNRVDPGCNPLPFVHSKLLMHNTYVLARSSCLLSLNNHI